MRIKVMILSVLFVTALSGVGISQPKSSGSLPCINGISNLTDDQKNQITDLEEDHQKEMNTYRVERRSTTDQNLKDQVYDKMKQAKSNHQSQVLQILNEDQKKEYLAIQKSGRGQFRNNSGTRCGVPNGKGLGQGRGRKGSGKCKVNFRGNIGQGRNRVNNNR
ncbi:hypothetical protein [uncultured Sunxiuqinia sp.]|uniref:hypothetical protein n=1 Tax=uncultured Sunxiuqinia sp. TaxID=1573825 RepID=UPI002AA800CE|nr:hypothetical protein [uncultured Sunxiuqinia sp.]